MSIQKLLPNAQDIQVAFGWHEGFLTMLTSRGASQQDFGRVDDIPPPMVYVSKTFTLSSLRAHDARSSGRGCGGGGAQCAADKEKDEYK